MRFIGRSALDLCAETRSSDAGRTLACRHRDWRTPDIELGSIVVYRGRDYILIGLTHASSDQEHAVIENALTGEVATVPLDEVDQLDQPHS
jgi:hypothetical protein